MKKVIFVVCGLFAAATASADGFRHEGWRGGYEHRGGGDWVGPIILGGVIGYELSRPRPAPTVVYGPPPVVYTPAPAPVPYGYHYEQILDANCNCYRMVLAPN